MGYPKDADGIDRAFAGGLFHSGDRTVREVDVYQCNFLKSSAQSPATIAGECLNGAYLVNEQRA
ncbi:hypothetical protein BB934_25595 [Microvirga ossetica]|uniref:Uncharacterized protein n=1 Tax=Microvirga ossetica TaxID=1882682 RepID=A0A1B2EMI9_9HYPH|nr:hypothetical protein BB934_25595 [Microvirga ossetica]